MLFLLRKKQLVCSKTSSHSYWNCPDRSIYENPHFHDCRSADKLRTECKTQNEVSWQGAKCCRHSMPSVTLTTGQYWDPKLTMSKVPCSPIGAISPTWFKSIRIMYSSCAAFNLAWTTQFNIQSKISPTWFKSIRIMNNSCAAFNLAWTTHFNIPSKISPTWFKSIRIMCSSCAAFNLDWTTQFNMQSESSKIRIG